MDGRPVDGLLAVPNRELVGDREGLAVADHHALDRVVRNPGADPGVHAHPGDADLVLRPVLVLVGVGRERLLVRSPSELGGGRALLAEALDAPGVHEFVDLLRDIRDLRVALAAVDHLDAELMGQVVELLGGDEVLERLGLPALDPLLGQGGSRDVEETLLGEVGNEAGVGPVLDHGGRALLLPFAVHLAHVHVAPVEGALSRVLLAPGIGVPDLDGGVDVEDAVVMAPLQDLAGIDVPGQVDQDIAGREVLAEHRVHVLLRDLVADVADALGGPLAEFLLLCLEIDHGDVLRGHLDVLKEDGERAFGDGAVADKEDLVAEIDHDALEVRLGRLREAWLVEEVSGYEGCLLRHTQERERVLGGLFGRGPRPFPRAWRPSCGAP